MSVKIADFSKNGVGLARQQRFMNPGYALEPNELKISRAVGNLSNKSLETFVASHVQAGQFSDDLNPFCFGTNVPDRGDDGFINVPVRKMFQQVLESKKSEFFFK
jgi:hypothetical protein